MTNTDEHRACEVTANEDQTGPGWGRTGWAALPLGGL